MVNVVKEVKAKLAELDVYEAQIKEERKFLKKRLSVITSCLTEDEKKQLAEMEQAQETEETEETEGTDTAPDAE